MSFLAMCASTALRQGALGGRTDRSRTQVETCRAQILYCTTLFHGRRERKRALPGCTGQKKRILCIGQQDLRVCIGVLGRGDQRAWVQEVDTGTNGAAENVVNILKVQIKTLQTATENPYGCKFGLHRKPLGVGPETQRKPVDLLQSAHGWTNGNPPHSGLGLGTSRSGLWRTNLGQGGFG